MSAFELVIAAGALCGVLMVVGSIYLLRVGAIELKSLAGEADKPALQIVINEITVTTRYPAIGLFIIGLAFILGSAWFSKPDRDFAQFPVRIQITPGSGGVIPDSIDARILVSSESIPIRRDKEEYIYTHPRNPRNLYGEMYIPGAPPIRHLINLEDGVWFLNLDLSNQIDLVAERPPEEGRTIERLE